MNNLEFSAWLEREADKLRAGGEHPLRRAANRIRKLDLLLEEKLDIITDLKLSILQIDMVRRQINRKKLEDVIRIAKKIK